MNNKRKIIVTLALLFTATALQGQTTQLKVATISAGAARLDNGSLVNIGQPLVGTFGSTQAGITGSAGIVSVLRPPTPQPRLPEFNSVTFSAGGVVRLSFQVTPGWTYGVEASTNLIQWSSLWTTQATVATITFEDLNTAQFERRFYRIVTY